MSPQTASTVGAVAGPRADAVGLQALPERSLEARWRLLTEVGDALNARLDAPAVLAELARLCVPRLADYCVTYLLDGKHGSLIRGGVAHADPAGEQLVQRLLSIKPPTLDDPVGAGAVIRTGDRILAKRISDQLLESVAQGE
jgi:hypothetical protein